MDADTILDDWYLINFNDSNKKHLFGTVIHDSKSRFNQGYWCCTSIITDKIDEQTLKTAYSVYQVKGRGKVVDMPLSALSLLRKGIK